MIVFCVLSPSLALSDGVVMVQFYVPSRSDVPAFISTSLISSSSWSLMVMLLGRRPEERVATSRNPPVAMVICRFRRGEIFKF